MSGENAEAARLFLGPPLLIRGKFVCAESYAADSADGKNQVNCLNLETGDIKQLASSEEGEPLVRIQDIWDGKLRVRDTEGDVWYVDCATGRRVENVLTDDSGMLLHIRAQIGKYYLIDVGSDRWTKQLWINEKGEPVYSYAPQNRLALIAKEDYWAGRPDYRIFKQEGEAAE